MGQYYMAYVGNDGGRKVFCPQNAIYMTKNGIERPSDIKEHSYSEDPNSWGSNFSGLKLMEHSWFENDFVNGIVEQIRDNPCHVAWVGDYAEYEYDFDGRYTRDVYESVWGERGLDEAPFPEVPKMHRTGYLANITKEQYIDLGKYAEVAGFTPKWDKGHTCIIHPLPILTVIGNGRGGGDYHGTCMEMVGAWAMDTISFTETRPDWMTELDCNSVAFKEE